MKTIQEYYETSLTADFKEAQSIADDISQDLFAGKKNGVIMLVLSMLLAKAIVKSKNKEVEDAGFAYVEGFARNFLKQFRDMAKNRNVQ